MPHHKSAKKRVKQTIKRTNINKTRSTKAKSAIKELKDAIRLKKKEDALTLFKQAQALLHKLAQKGVIKLNNASRRISRLQSQISKMS